MKLFLSEKLGEIGIEIDYAKEANKVLILAHGAGAGMEHPFMSVLAKTICRMETHVVRFNFPYKEKGRKAPGSQKDAIFAWDCVVQKVSALFPDLSVFISGKSYGGRMASHLLAEGIEKKVNGVIYFGFPLHAPGRDSVDRASHLSQIQVPQLFIQGTKDKLANIGLMTQVVAGLKSARMEVIEEADHSFNLPKKLGVSQDQVMERLASTSTDWMNQMALRS